MPIVPKGPDWYRRPELALAGLFQATMRGELGNQRGLRLFRAVVLAVDDIGGRLQNPNAVGSVESLMHDGTRRKFTALVGPTNPRGSIKARILSDGLDRLSGDDAVRVFWPLFSDERLSMPIAPGEHVYIIFEDEMTEHGLWISRVSGHDNPNVFVGASSYIEPSRPSSGVDFFDGNEASYDKTDENASLAPSINSAELFDG